MTVNGEDETWVGPHGGPPPQGPGQHQQPVVNPGSQGPTPQSGYFDEPYGEPGRQNWGPADPQYRPDPRQGQYPPGQYPPGQYPPNQYPNQGGRRILVEDDQGAFGQDDYGYDDYEDDYRSEEFTASRRGPGQIMWFVLAAVAVVVLGLAFAAMSVLGGGDDLDATADSTTTSQATTTSLSTTTTASTLPPNALDMQLLSPLFVCDGSTQQLGRIAGAAASEEVTFTSPQSSSIKPGQADAAGNLDIRWNCGPEQIGTVWELTATGATSGKTATVTFTGASAEQAAAATGVGDDGATGSTEDAQAPSALGPLTVTITENPFSCDGEARQFAVLNGATAGAEIAFTSPQASNIRSGTADANGDLAVRWVCSPDQVGTVWDLTATEAETNRSVDFAITGQ